MKKYIYSYIYVCIYHCKSINQSSIYEAAEHKGKGKILIKAREEKEITNKRIWQLA